MIKFSKVLLSLLAILSLVIAGCGGGGGNNTPKPPANSRIISGKIVSSSTNAGVANVKVTLGNTSTTSITDNSGNFKLTASANNTIPTFIKIDTSGAGANFPVGNVISFNNQTYKPSFIDIPIDVLNALTNSIGTITIYDTSGNNAPPPPFASKNTIISGRIVSLKTGLGIANATLIFGADNDISVLTGAKGYFAVNLGKDASVLSYYPNGSGVFKLNTSTAGSAFPSTLTVSLNGVNYLQSSITVPSEIIGDDTTILGTIFVRDNASGGGDNPPPPPTDDTGDGDNPPPPPPF